MNRQCIIKLQFFYIYWWICISQGIICLKNLGAGISNWNHTQNSAYFVFGYPDIYIYIFINKQGWYVNNLITMTSQNPKKNISVSVGKAVDISVLFF